MTTVPRRSPDPDDRKRDPERTKARIVEAAVAEFGAKGFAATRVSAIAERAGVNKQLISYYFGGKEGLFKEITGRWLRHADVLREGPLAEVVRRFALSTATHRDWARLLVWTNVTEDDSPPDQGETEHFRAQVEDVRRRQAEGEIPADLDPAAFLLAMTAAASATIFMPQMARRITGRDPASPEFTEHYAEQLARLIGHLG
ncbi:TetR family transcriptional regulator [Saccharothrix mutabilis subsp. mutabilis]|uniref:TetR family transcriptional regulator n=1 Tax=Saccharothrix mutabilis subsp. mutabilis TaxID=66855 RepID=A0ABN0TRS0_9PSEU